MNSRILELAKESDLIRYESDGNMERVEQFAKLIVRELADHIMNSSDRHRREYFANKILDYFDMETKLEENWDHYSGLPSPNAYKDD